MLISLWRWVIVYIGDIYPEYPETYYVARLGEMVEDLKERGIECRRYFIEVDRGRVYAHAHVPMGMRTKAAELIEEWAK